MEHTNSKILLLIIAVDNVRSQPPIQAFKKITSSIPYRTPS
jgi:hypothetical protein